MAKKVFIISGKLLRLTGHQAGSLQSKILRTTDARDELHAI